MSEFTKKNDNVGSAIRSCILMATMLGVGVLISLLFSGCGKKEEPATEVVPSAEELVEDSELSELPEMSAHAEDDITEEDIMNITAGAASESSSEEEYAADAEDVPEDATLVEFPSSEDDPYGMYKVSDEWTDTHDGAFLVKDGNKYALSKMVPEDVIDRYGVGCKTANAYVALYMNDQIDQDSIEVPTKTPECMIACGDFPILQLRRDDTVLGYGSCTKLDIEKMSFVGYTIEAVRRPGDSHLTYFPLVDHGLVLYSISLHDGAMQKTGVYDLNDNPVEDIHDLNYGQEYLFEYYLGAEYHEIRKIANCRCYTPEGSEKQRIDGELTKNGYVTFDFSVLEPGIYSAGSSVFEIVE